MPIFFLHKKNFFKYESNNIIHLHVIYGCYNENTQKILIGILLFGLTIAQARKNNESSQDEVSTKQ